MTSNSASRVAWSFWTDPRTWVACSVLAISLVAAVVADMTLVAWLIGGMTGIWFERATTAIGGGTDDE